MFAFLVDLQRMIHSALSADIAAFADSPDWMTLLAMLPLGIVFGAAHALTPGHSKLVLATYVLGAGMTAGRALMSSLVLSVTHIGSAVVLAAVTNTLITRTLVGAGRAPSIEWTSRLMLAGIGIWYVIRALRRRSHAHHEGVAVGLVAGLIPCPLTLFVMTFALSRGVAEAGLAFAISMLAGVAAILAAVALAAAFARDFLVAFLDRHGHLLGHLSRGVEVLAGAALTSVALYELSR